jgi:two-component system OmpR family response regulator
MLGGPAYFMKYSWNTFYTIYMKILLVEDEARLASALVRGLTTEGHTTDIVDDGQKAFMRISLHRTDYDLVILDLMLPSLGGREICKQVREQGISIPILVLTAIGDMDVKVDTLLMGADDYMIKPFSFAELAARVRALGRRPVDSAPEILELQSITLNVPERRVMIEGTELELTLKEFGLLEYFMRHPSIVIGRDDLLNHLWDFNYVGLSNVVDVHVKNLRRKLESNGVPNVIKTVRGVGYKVLG